MGRKRKPGKRNKRRGSVNPRKMMSAKAAARRERRHRRETERLAKCDAKRLLNRQASRPYA